MISIRIDEPPRKFGSPLAGKGLHVKSTTIRPYEIEMSISHDL